jgi:hypothetical protein
MVVLAFCIGSLSLFHGFRSHHHRYLPLMVFSAGFVFLVLKQFFHQQEILFLLPAVIFILSGHILNYYYCRQSNHCHVDDCDH